MNGKCVSWRLKLRQKTILHFYVRGLGLPKSSSCRLGRAKRKVRKCYLQRLNFRTKSWILQSVNLLDYNCLTSIFFQCNVSFFEGSNCFLRFILDSPLDGTADWVILCVLLRLASFLVNWPYRNSWYFVDPFFFWSKFYCSKK